MVKVISLPYIFQVLYVLYFTRPRHQVSVYRTTGPLVIFIVRIQASFSVTALEDSRRHFPSFDILPYLKCIYNYFVMAINTAQTICSCRDYICTLQL